MIGDLKKFNKEVKALNLLKNNRPSLHPLAQEQVKQKILLALKGSDPQVSLQKSGLSLTKLHWAKVAAIAGSGLAVLTGTAFASTAANPGDMLYPVKRAQEQVILKLAPTEESKAKLQANFAQERIQEIKNLSVTPKAKPKAATKPSLPVLNPASSAPTSTAAVASSTPEAAKTDDTFRRKAKKEISDAIKSLQDAEKRLQKQGNNKAAEHVRENANKIKREAKEQNLLDESADD